MGPVLLRRQSRVLFKYFRKIALVLKTGGYRNINQRIIGVGQKALALLHPHHIQVFLKRRTAGLFEYGRKIGRI